MRRGVTRYFGGGTNLDAFDRRRIVRTIVRVARRADDFVGDVHPLRHLTEDAVLAVERRIFGNHDEELRRGAVRIIRARHRHDAALVRDRAEFGVDGLRRTARSPSLRRTGDRVWIAALDHEAGDDAMKLGAVVEAFLREIDEVLHMIRRHVGKEADVDLAGARVKLGDFVLVIAHRFLLARRRVRRSGIRGDGLSRRRAAFGLRGVVVRGWRTRKNERDRGKDQVFHGGESYQVSSSGGQVPGPDWTLPILRVR